MQLHPRRTLCLSLVRLALLGLLSTDASAAPDPIALALGDAMAGFTATLDEEQRDGARYDFNDKERFDLRLAPRHRPNSPPRLAPAGVLPLPPLPETHLEACISVGSG